MKVLGYYLERDGSLENRDVLVAIDEGNKRLTCYSPKEQHSEMDRGYLDECTEITKEQYIEASNIFYTPKDYL